MTFAAWPPSAQDQLKIFFLDSSQPFWSYLTRLSAHYHHPGNALQLFTDALPWAVRQPWSDSIPWDALLWRYGCVLKTSPLLDCMEHTPGMIHKLTMLHEHPETQHALASRVYQAWATVLNQATHSMPDGLPLYLAMAKVGYLVDQQGFSLCDEWANTKLATNDVSTLASRIARADVPNDWKWRWFCLNATQRHWIENGERMRPILDENHNDAARRFDFLPWGANPDTNKALSNAYYPHLHMLLESLMDDSIWSNLYQEEPRRQLVDTIWALSPKEHSVVSLPANMTMAV